MASTPYFVEHLPSLEGRIDVAVAYDGDAHPRVVLNLAYEGPVSLSSVHLRASAAVDGYCGDADVLQPFRGVDDELGVLVPPEAGLDRDGCVVNGLNDTPCHLDHFGDVSEHSGAGSFAGHLLDGASEVNVDNVGSALLHYFGGLNHWLNLAPVNLYADRPLGGVDVELFHRALDVAYYSVGRDELGVHEVGPVAFAEAAEGHVCDVFHWGEQHGARTEVKVSYSHV